MPITMKHEGGKVEVLHAGRVLEMRTFQANRNMSDTLDYSDYQTVEVTEALVWLGPVGRPEGRGYGAERPLEFFEQFAWIDVSNHFAWRSGVFATAAVDATMGQGEPLMWANYLAWQGWMEANRAARIRAEVEREALIAATEAAAAQRAAEKAAKSQAKLEATKAAAEALLARAPKKGSTLTIGGVTGKVCWVGTAKYRGAYTARFGLKDSRGNVTWHPVA